MSNDLAESIPYRVIRSPRRRRTIQAQMSDGVLVIRIPARMSAAEERQAVQDIVGRVARKQGTSRHSDAQLASRAQYLNETYLGGRAKLGSIRWVSNQNTRWGSCTTSTGDIRISDRLKSVPDYVVDSVIIHELTHTFIPGHGREFWQWADKAPQAERAKGYLEAYQRFSN